MKIQYLGTSAAEGIPAIFCECENCKRAMQLGGKNIRTRSQALVDDTILIDFPADTYMHYLNHKFPMYHIKHCIITHSHSDHLYPRELEMRTKMFSHLTDKETPLTFYAWESGYELISDIIKTYNVKDHEAVVKLIKPFETFKIEDYSVTAIPASHDKKSSPVVYLIEKNGKELFYSNDTSEYNEESMSYLKNRNKAIDLISLDCTEACNHTTYVGHLSLERCIKLKDLLIRENIANESTNFILNHFSHNGKNVNYDDFYPIASKYGFETSYDGLVIEF